MASQRHRESIKSTLNSVSRLPTSVIVPTYRRPECLARCLAGLAQQTEADFETIVVVRSSDQETMDAVPRMEPRPAPTRIVQVNVPGVVAAMTAGLEAACGATIALIDDDAVPHADWLHRIALTLERDPDVAGVGGKDNLYRNGNLVVAEAKVVGKLQWWGRHVGNHHLGSGGPREVDVLKGANCAFRAELLRTVGFDKRLLGMGAQVHWELSLCLSLRRAGYRLIYDPAIQVDHYPASRFDEDQRSGFSFEARYNEAFNETIVLLDHLGRVQRAVFLIWAILVGTRAVPGLLQWARLSLMERKPQYERVRAAVKGRVGGWRYWSASRPGGPPNP